MGDKGGKKDKEKGKKQMTKKHDQKEKERKDKEPKKKTQKSGRIILKALRLVISESWDWTVPMS